MDGFRKRLAICVGVLLVLGVLVGLIGHFGPDASFFPKCVLHSVTGMHCPGCGMTRAVSSVVQGQWLAAFRCNPLLMLLLPVLLLGYLWEVIGWLRGRPMPWRFRISRRVGWWLVGLVLLFGVLRNIPCWPFTLLAPRELAAEDK